MHLIKKVKTKKKKFVVAVKNLIISYLFFNE